MLTFGLQDHSCALTSGGAVSCWGNNEYNQVTPNGVGINFWLQFKETMFLTCFCAAWRRLYDQSTLARSCSWLGQRGGCDCFRKCRIVSCDVTCSRDRCLLLS